MGRAHDDAARRARRRGATWSATLERLTHEARPARDDLGERSSTAVERDPSDPLSAALARLGREDWERTRLVPPELSAAIAAAGADGLARWQRARAADDFTVFAPAVERNVELARAYAGCFAGTVEHPYDALLANFDPGLPGAMIATLFSRLAEQLPPLVAAASRAAGGAARRDRAPAGGRHAAGSARCGRSRLAPR